MLKHPLATYVYVYACDLIALCIILYQLSYVYAPSPLYIWVHFCIWTLIICVARFGVFELFNLRIQVGWQSVMEIAALLILPFPFYCLSIVISAIFIMLHRVRSGHPEPFLGPDFNAANVIISAGLASIVFEQLSQYLPDVSFRTTLALLGMTIIFATVNILLLSILLAIDQKKPFLKVGSFNKDILLSEGLMITIGLLIGRIYQLDVYVIPLVLLPVLFLHKTLRKLNEAKFIYLDEKTGLYNYRFFDEQLARLFQEAAQKKRPLSLIFGDIDYLRTINNTYGHMIGDLALKAVANVFREAAEEGMIAARFGGEEFVLLAPDCDIRKATQLAENIRIGVEKATVHLETGEEISITISMGVSAFPQHAKAIEELIKAADVALYEAKREGRNNVCTFQ